MPLLEPGGIEGLVRREVLPHVPDAWIDEEGAKTGYEISFTRYFLASEGSEVVIPAEAGIHTAKCERP